MEPSLASSDPTPAKQPFAARGSVTATGLALGLPTAVATLLGVAYLSMSALPPVPVPPQNPITPAKAVLGKILFWDEQLSTSNVVSCGTCHSPANAGADGRIARNPGPDGLFNSPDDDRASPGVISSDSGNNYLSDALFGLNPQVTDRAANSTIMAAYAPQLFWDGRASGQFVDPVTNVVLIPNGGALESQAIQPILSSVEMAHAGFTFTGLVEKLASVRPLDLATNHPADVAAALADAPDYPELFRRAFGDSTISAARIAFAMATYQRTLIADQTPFDAFRAGQANAMTQNQIQGFNAFQGPGARCSTCHNVNQDLFTDNTFRNIGLRPPSEDLGRQIVTGNPNDRGRFKVPGLRNASLKLTFMHNGQFSNIRQVVDFYARAPGAPQQFADNRDPIMPTINFPPQVANQITDFLANALTDPRVRNQTFPFDRPLLFADRPADRATLEGGGVAGTGNVIPRMIAQAPPMVGNFEYRLGVDGVPSNTQARLGISSVAPVNGRITPERFLDPVNANLTGTATVHWPLVPGQVSGGQVLYAQWFVSDTNAPSGTSLSTVARIPFFCGSAGCPQVCLADYDISGSVDGDDVILFFADWDSGLIRADVNADGSVDGDDVILFFARWDTNC